MSKKKLDPKAKVRNRGDVVVPAERAKDNKDHYPINSKDQAANALSRVNQYSKVPSWYKGSLESLINAVYRKVHSKYPSIEIDKSKKKPGKQSETKHILENFKKCAELYLEVYGIDASDTIYSEDEEPKEDEEEVKESSFDHASVLLKAAQEMFK